MGWGKGGSDCLIGWRGGAICFNSILWRDGGCALGGVVVCIAWCEVFVSHA